MLSGQKQTADFILIFPVKQPIKYSEVSFFYYEAFINPQMQKSDNNGMELSLSRYHGPSISSSSVL
jgi:hypothetical protein